MMVGKSGLHCKACTSNAFLNVQKMVSKLRFWSSFLRRCVGDSSVSRQFPTFRINNRRSRALFTTCAAQPGTCPEGSTELTPMIECCPQGSITNRWSISLCTCPLIDVPERVGNALNTVVCCRKDSPFMTESGIGSIDRFSMIGQSYSGMEAVNSHEEDQDRNAERPS